MNTKNLFPYREDGEHKKGHGEGKQTSNPKEIVLKVYMHCEACAIKVSNCLKGFDGVQGVNADLENDRVMVFGDGVDAGKVLERIRKKFTKNAELISPKFQPTTEKKEPEKKKEEPKLKTIVLKMHMHCQGCVDDIKRSLLRMEGVVTVEADMAQSTVAIRCIKIDAPKLVEKVAKRLGRQSEIVKQEVEKERSNNGSKKRENKEENIAFQFQYPPQYSAQHIYPSQIFSDENILSCSMM